MVKTELGHNQTTHNRFEKKNNGFENHVPDAKMSIMIIPTDPGLNLPTSLPLGDRITKVSRIVNQSDKKIKQSVP